MEAKSYDSRQAMEKALGLKQHSAPKPQFGRHHERHWMEVDEENQAFPVPSPDGKMEAYIEGYNVVLHEVGKPYSVKRILTQDGTIGMYYSNRIQWSPDGSHLFVCKRIPVEKRYAYYVERRQQTSCSLSFTSKNMPSRVMLSLSICQLS